jgi:hypothetical protein
MIKLETGHIIERRNGTKALVMLNYLGTGTDVIIGDHVFSKNLEFISPHTTGFDIVAVYKPRYFITTLQIQDEDHELLWKE